jgi:hypothetical protein
LFLPAGQPAADGLHDKCKKKIARATPAAPIAWLMQRGFTPAVLRKTRFGLTIRGLPGMRLLAFRRERYIVRLWAGGKSGAPPGTDYVYYVH